MASTSTTRILKAIGQIGFSIAALWLVFSKIDLSDFWEYATSINLLWLIIALILLNIGQIISGLRLRYYLNSIGVHMERLPTVMLYYVGLFLNHLLPGGIGGDGYKVWYVKKYKQAKVSDAIRRVLSARANGLLALMLITICMTPFSPAVADFSYGVLFSWLCLPIVVIAYYLGSLWILKEPLNSQLGAFPYSLGVQLTNLLCAYALLIGLDVGGAHIDYLLLFMVSCIASVIPISFGGARLRELTFLWLAPFMQVDVEAGIAMSLIYFIINILASLQGIVFFHKLTRS